MRWLTINWWKYLFEKPCTIRKFFCRAKGHENVRWYNMNGTEPDMHCINCDDDLN